MKFLTRNGIFFSAVTHYAFPRGAARHGGAKGGEKKKARFLAKTVTLPSVARHFVPCCSPSWIISSFAELYRNPSVSRSLAFDYDTFRETFGARASVLSA